MGTRGIQDPVAADLIEQLLAEQARLNEEIMDLRQAMPVLMERARPADITVPQEGQIVVDPDATHNLASDEPIKYFENGEWRALIAPASIHHVPHVTVGSIEATLPQSTFSGTTWSVKDTTWADNVNTRVWDKYDFSNASSRVFDVSMDQLPSSALGIKKKGLYLLVSKFIWPPEWGKLSRLTVYLHNSASTSQCILATGNSFGDAYFDNEAFMGDEEEAGDAITHIAIWSIWRHTQDVTKWVRTGARHITATRTPFNMYTSAIRLAANPNDTDVDDGGTIPG